jgi:hypothetical protein
MKKLPRIGSKVRFLGYGYANQRNVGDRVIGEGRPTAWLCVGAVGTVLEHRDGYPRHRCPDHERTPDCVCGDESDGWVKEMEPWAVVAFETDQPGRMIRRAVSPSDRGKTFEVVR